MLIFLTFLYVLGLQWTWIKQPGHLVFHDWIQSVPFVFILELRWESPKDLLDDFNQNGIPVVENVHANEIEIQKVKKQVLDLSCLNSNSNQV